MAASLGKWLLPIDGESLPDKELIGGKAWSIARMSALGLPVPPAFVITTRACGHVLGHGQEPEELAAEIQGGVAWLETQSGRRFGQGPKPLLVSVRSGAPISMPGMMDTVLNLGINDETEQLLALEFADGVFARDTHRRFLELYSHIVLKADVTLSPDGNIADWRSAVEAMTGAQVPQNPEQQLAGAIRAVFESWNSRRARRYREHHGIPHDLGTAVTVQVMVFGNLDDLSGTGVLFSRNPLTGEKAPYGEYLPQAQGEDIVSGKHTPLALDTMRETMPDIHAELIRAAELLEEAAGDAQDIEFTLEARRLYLLQTRVAKRAPLAAVRMAVEMVTEGRLTPAQALARLTPEQIRTLLGPRLADGAEQGVSLLARGEAASPGVGCGVIVTDSDEAERRASAGEAIILARATTSPEDVHGMIAARAIITEQGGSTSHAAVVGRSLGRPCVVGCGQGSLQSLAGRLVTVDGSRGLIFDGALPVITPSERDDAWLVQIARWAEAHSPVQVVTNHAGSDLLDFDELTDLDRLLAQVRSGTTVKGKIFANDETLLRGAIRAGAAVIVTEPALPVLLLAAQIAASDRKD